MHSMVLDLADKLGTSLSLSQSSITSSDALVPNTVARSSASSGFEELDVAGVEADVVSKPTSSLSTMY